MKTTCALGAAALLVVTACSGGDGQGAAAPGATANGTAAQAAAAPGAAAAAPAAGGAPAAAPAPAGAVPAGNFEGRTLELTNPEPSAMVFLYHDLTGVPLAIDQIVASDYSVQYATGPEKAAKREQMKASLESGLAAVAGVGMIRLTANASMSAYDPSYGEFTIGSLSPSTSFPFQAFGETVSLKFANAQQAQVWKVAPAEAQAISDKIRYMGNVNMDVLVKVLRVQPAPKGGTIIAQVISYELRDQQSNATLGRVTVPQ